MSFQNTILPLIDQLTELNSILNRTNISTNIDIKHIIDKLVKKEKDYQILKFNIEQSEENLQKNIKLLKSKCELEFQIYTILANHRQRLNRLKEENEGLPEIDSFIEKLFDFSKNGILNDLESINSQEPVNNKPKLPEKKSSLSNISKPQSKLKSTPISKPAIKLDSTCLQSQLTAAIKSRKNKLDNLS